MAIAVDSLGTPNITTAFTSTVTKTFSHTCAGSNRLLVLCATLWQDVAGTGTITAASYNGVAMTKANAVTQGAMRSEIWYLFAPTTGANTVSVTVTGATDNIKLSTSSYTGVLQAAGTDGNNTAIGSSGNPTISLTTTTANDLVIATLSRFSTTAATTSQTAIYNNATGSTLGAASYQLAAAAGSKTDTYTGSVANDWSMVMAAFKPDTGTAPTFKGLMLLGVGA